MANQLDFVVNWVNDFSVRREFVFLDTFLICNMDYFPSCRYSTALPCHAVDLVPLTFLLLRMTSSHDIQKNQVINIRYQKIKKHNLQSSALTSF
jgi:hypothetical protein